MAKKDKLIAKAQKFIQKGAIDKAISEYVSILALEPSDISIRLRLGDLYVKTNDKDNALKEYNAVAKVHTEKGFYLKSIAVFKQILKLDEESLEVHSKLADLYTKQRLHADAISEYNYIVNVYESKGRTTEAFDLIKKMVEIDPDNVGVKLKLADMHQKLGFEKDAFEEYCWIFEKLISQGKGEKAGKILIDLYKEHSKEPRILEGLRTLFKKKGDKNNYVKYSSELMEVYRLAGDEDNAKGICQQILDADDNNSDAVEYMLELKGETPADTAIEVELEEDEALIDFPGSDDHAEEVVSDEGEEEGPLIEISMDDDSAEDEPLIDMGTEEELDEVEELDELEEVEELEELEELSDEVEVDEPDAVEFEEPVAEEPAVEEESIEAEAAPSAVDEAGDATESSIDDLSLDDFKDFSSTTDDSDDDALFKDFSDETTGEGPDGFVDLSKELGVEEALDQLTSSWGGDDSDDAAEEMKAGMGEQLNKEDIETHFNLGIAYMEMELYDEAAREFKLSTKDPSFEFEAYTRLGLCYTSAGDNDESISYYLKALAVTGRSDEDRIGVMYELGLVYVAADKNSDALEIFKTVKDMDASYREVEGIVANLSEGKAPIPKDDDMMEVELL